MQLFAHFTEGLQIAYRALWSNKLRAALTILGILIGVTTVILMVTIILGLNKSVEGQFSFLGSNTLYISRWDWFGDNWRAMMKRDPVEADVAEDVKRQSQLAVAVSPLASTNATIAYRNRKVSRVEIMGVNEDYLETNSVRIDLGRFFTGDDIQRNRQVAVIGSSIATTLFENVPPLGQKIDIGGHKFRVVGVNAKMGRFFGQDMDNFILIPIGAFTKRYSSRRADINIVAKAASPELVEEMRWELKGIMRRIRHLEPTEPDDFGINGQSQIMSVYKQVTGSIYTGGVLIAFISLLVGGIGIMNIMLVSVTERTSEVGLRKALGAKRWMVAWQFLVEAAALCSVGGLFGVGLAWLGGKAMSSVLPTSMPLWVVFFGIAFSALIGVFFGLYPSLKAARLSPIEALRQE